MEEIKSGYTRVSTILNMVPSFTGMSWIYPMASIDQQVLSEKASIGSQVHLAIAASVKDQFYPLNEKEKPYFESYKKWAKRVKLKTLESELRLYDDGLKITGCVDMVGKLNEAPDWTIIDFKCTVFADTFKWPLQGAFYEYLLRMNQYHFSKEVIFVQLDKNGELPKIYQFTIDNKLMTAMISVYNTFMYLTQSVTIL